MSFIFLFSLLVVNHRNTGGKKPLESNLRFKVLGEDYAALKFEDLKLKFVAIALFYVPCNLVYS